MELAINGGKKVRTIPFQDQITYGEEEIKAVNDFMRNGNLLSNYRGNWIKEFWGGEQVKALEDQWSEKFDSQYCPAVNSCTSALQIACGAIGLQPGDEVIVTPWSMSCSATAPLLWGAIPVFADIDPNTFCLDPESVRKQITPKTRAIIAVDLFGHPFSEEINEIAEEFDLWIIEDAAQAPGALRGDKFTGNLGHIGCFSFTQGKHMTCGEGGMITTDDERLAMRCALLRNHADATINAMPQKTANSLTRQKILDPEFSKLSGFNMRMTELQAVIMLAQLKKLNSFIASRNKHAGALYGEITNACSFISYPKISENITHSFYVQGFLFDEEKAGVSRDLFIKAVKAELMGELTRPDRPMLGCGYIQPLYRMPIFQTDGIMTEEYIKETFPVVERLWKKDFFLSMYHNLPLDIEDRKEIVLAFKKVTDNINELKLPVVEENIKLTPSYWRNV